MSTNILHFTSNHWFHIFRFTFTFTFTFNSSGGNRFLCRFCIGCRCTCRCSIRFSTTKNARVRFLGSNTGIFLSSVEWRVPALWALCDCPTKSPSLREGREGRSLSSVRGGFLKIVGRGHGKTTPWAFGKKLPLVIVISQISIGRCCSFAPTTLHISASAGRAWARKNALSLGCLSLKWPIFVPVRKDVMTSSNEVHKPSPELRLWLWSSQRESDSRCE